MHLIHNDTIAAICSGPGSSITIIRISGPKSKDIGSCVFKSGKLSPFGYPFRLVLGKAVTSDDSIGDTAFGVFMPSPKTYTGEDIFELHAHGGNFNAIRLLEEVVKQGARPAIPGEFTYRAFINGKLDLTQAEAVADLITAGSKMSVRLAERQLSGILGEKITHLRKTLLEILTETEARIDFPEEELDFTPHTGVMEQLEKIRYEIKKLYETRYEGAVLRDGVRTVIAGRPNAGKSSLLNFLLGYERAITTEIPGTTRDTLEEFTNIRGIPVKLIDTAGIRKSENIVEELGIRRSLTSIRAAQIIIWLLDASAANLANEISEMEKHFDETDNFIPVWNKTDLLQADDVLPETRYPILKISVIEQTGIDALLDCFEHKVWSSTAHPEPETAVSARHAAELEKALSVIPEILFNYKNKSWELAASGIKSAVTALGNITGENPTIDIYDAIFSKFCIGK